MEGVYVRSRQPSQPRIRHRYADDRLVWTRVGEGLWSPDVPFALRLSLSFVAAAFYSDRYLASDAALRRVRRIRALYWVCDVLSQRSDFFQPTRQVGGCDFGRDLFSHRSGKPRLGGAHFTLVHRRIRDCLRSLSARTFQTAEFSFEKTCRERARHYGYYAEANRRGKSVPGGSRRVARQDRAIGIWQPYPQRTRKTGQCPRRDHAARRRASSLKHCGV